MHHFQYDSLELDQGYNKLVPKNMVFRIPKISRCAQTLYIYIYMRRISIPTASLRSLHINFCHVATSTTAITTTVGPSLVWRFGCLAPAFEGHQLEWRQALLRLHRSPHCSPPGHMPVWADKANPRKSAERKSLDMFLASSHRKIWNLRRGRLVRCSRCGIRCTKELDILQRTVLLEPFSFFLCRWLIRLDSSYARLIEWINQNPGPDGLTCGNGPANSVQFFGWKGVTTR